MFLGKVYLQKEEDTEYLLMLIRLYFFCLKISGNKMVFLNFFLLCSSLEHDKNQERASISKPKNSDLISVKEKFIHAKVYLNVLFFG